MAKNEGVEFGPLSQADEEILDRVWEGLYRGVGIDVTPDVYIYIKNGVWYGDGDQIDLLEARQKDTGITGDARLAADAREFLHHFLTRRGFTNLSPNLDGK